jgi:hypothetical protein
MTEAEIIIVQHGGPLALAKKMGITEKWLPQRVHYWKTRGIPAALKLAHPDLLLSEQFLLDALAKLRARKKQEEAEQANHD